MLTIGCRCTLLVLYSICWFAIPFSLATSLGLAASALMLPISAAEAGSGLVPPAVATELLGTAGSALILIMLFMAIVSTGSAESMAVSSIFAYDIYREYYNPHATSEDILFVSRIVIVVFGLFMGCFSLALNALGLNLGWVYLFMGVVIGSAVCPLWNLMTWDKANAEGAVMAAWTGLFLGLWAWVGTALIESHELSVAALGTNKVMLCGNLVSILSSGIIHFCKSYRPSHDSFSKGTATLFEMDSLLNSRVLFVCLPLNRLFGRCSRGIRLQSNGNAPDACHTRLSWAYSRRSGSSQARLRREMD